MPPPEPERALDAEMLWAILCATQQERRQRKATGGEDYRVRVVESVESDFPTPEESVDINAVFPMEGSTACWSSLNFDKKHDLMMSGQDREAPGEMERGNTISQLRKGLIVRCPTWSAGAARSLGCSSSRRPSAGARMLGRVHCVCRQRLVRACVIVRIRFHLPPSSLLDSLGEERFA